MAALEQKEISETNAQEMEGTGLGKSSNGSMNSEDKEGASCRMQAAGRQSVDAGLDADQQNAAAGKKLSSRYRGVCWNKKNKRWQAAINSSGRYLYLGSYVSEEDAARAFDRAAIRIRGRKARINFKFDDYMEELEVHSRSQNSEFSSDMTLEMHGKPAVLGPTITSNVHSNFTSRDHRMINPAVNSTRTRFDSLESVVHHSGHADRHQHLTVMNGIPLQRDNLGMSTARSASQCVTKPDALVGRVVQRSLRPMPPLEPGAWGNSKGDQADSASPMMPAAHQLEQLQHIRQSNVPQYMDIFGCQEPNRGSAPEASPRDLPGGHQDQHVPWPQDGFPFAQTPGGAAPEDPMSTIPKDCHIVKIIPNASGVFAVLYARPGHVSTGVVIWDGQAVHNMGMFSTRPDAQQACNAACSIVVKLVRQLSGNTNQQGSLTADKEQDAGPGAQPTSQPLADPAAALRTGSQKDSPPVVVQCAPERQAPRTSPFVPENSGSLFKLISIPSQELSKYFGSEEISVPSSLNWGKTENSMPGTGLKSTKDGGQNTKNRAVAELIGENKGNLGSLLHYDSWSSSILGLISLSVAKGPDGLDKSDKGATVTAEFKADDKDMSIDAVPQSPHANIKNSEGQADAGLTPWKPSGLSSDRFRSEKDGRGGLSADVDGFLSDDWRVMNSSNSFPHFSPSRNTQSDDPPAAQCENGSYNDVVEMIVSHDRPNRRKPGVLAPSRAPGDTLVDNRANNDAEPQGSLKRRGVEGVQDATRHPAHLKKARALEKERL